MKFDFVKHKELSPEKLLRIATLKSEHWEYSIKEHLQWMTQNIKPNDVHLLLYLDDKLIGYLNLVHLSLYTEEHTEDFLGIGNVCVSMSKKKKGYGLLLMKLVDYYLKNNHQAGVLLCKEELKGFYEYSNWINYSGIVYINNMLFNHYVFFTKTINFPIINLSKSF